MQQAFAPTRLCKRHTSVQASHLCASLTPLCKPHISVQASYLCASLAPLSCPDRLHLACARVGLRLRLSGCARLLSNISRGFSVQVQLRSRRSLMRTMFWVRTMAMLRVRVRVRARTMAMLRARVRVMDTVHSCGLGPWPCSLRSPQSISAINVAEFTVLRKGGYMRTKPYPQPSP